MAEHREAQSCDCCHKPAVFLQSVFKCCFLRRDRALQKLPFANSLDILGI